jgi:O-acetylserine/cysteine efflux transporter
MKISHLFLILFVIFIWGFNFVIIKFGLLHIPPIFLVFLRFFLTSLPAVFFIKKPKVPWKMLASYGIVMFALQFSMLFVAMHHGITPSLAAILLQLQVFFTLGLASYVFKEKLYKSQILGALIAFCGVAFIAKNLGAEITLSGFLLVVGAASCSAPGNAICKKMGKANMLGVVVWSSLFAWPLVLCFSLYYEGIDAIVHGLKCLNWQSAGAALYVTYLSTLFGYFVWNDLIAKYSLGKIAPFTLLSPLIGTVASTLILHEPLHLWKIIAGSLILLGLLLNIFGTIWELKKEQAQTSLFIE